MCEGSGWKARVDASAVPTLAGTRLKEYHAAGCVPGGSKRNWASYGHRVDSIEGFERDLMCDPQTSGGLLISVSPESAQEVEQVLATAGLPSRCIGNMTNDHFAEGCCGPIQIRMERANARRRQKKRSKKKPPTRESRRVRFSGRLIDWN